MRNGYSTKIVQVKEFNRMVQTGELYDRSMSLVYGYFTIWGNFRKTGYVAYDYNRSAWAKTKKEALIKINEM